MAASRDVRQLPFRNALLIETPAVLSWNGVRSRCKTFRVKTKFDIMRVFAIAFLMLNMTVLVAFHCLLHAKHQTAQTECSERETLSLHLPGSTCEVSYKDFEGAVVDVSGCLAPVVLGYIHILPHQYCSMFDDASEIPLDKVTCFYQYVSFQKWKEVDHIEATSDAIIYIHTSRVRIDVLRRYSYKCSNPQLSPSENYKGVSVTAEEEDVKDAQVPSSQHDNTTEEYNPAAVRYIRTSPQEQLEQVANQIERMLKKLIALKPKHLQQTEAGEIIKKSEK